MTILSKSEFEAIVAACTVERQLPGVASAISTKIDVTLGVVDRSLALS